MALAEFTVADRQFPIGMQRGIINLHVSGAVHGFKPINTVLGLGGEHILFVIVPVAGFSTDSDREFAAPSLPGSRYRDRRRACTAQPVARSANPWGARKSAPALRPGNETGPVHGPVCGGRVFCFLEHCQVSGLLFLGCPGRAIDTL